MLSRRTFYVGMATLYGAPFNTKINMKAETNSSTNSPCCCYCCVSRKQTLYEVFNRKFGYNNSNHNPQPIYFTFSSRPSADRVPVPGSFDSSSSLRSRSIASRMMGTSGVSALPYTSVKSDVPLNRFRTHSTDPEPWVSLKPDRSSSTAFITRRCIATASRIAPVPGSPGGARVESHSGPNRSVISAWQRATLGYVVWRITSRCRCIDVKSPGFCVGRNVRGIAQHMWIYTRRQK